MYRQYLTAALLSLLLLLTAVFYFPGLAGPFLFDDGPALSSNPYLRIDGSQFEQWRVAIFSSASGPLQRPLAMWSFAVNQVAAGELATWPVKLVNLLVHLCCGGLVYVFAKMVMARVAPDMRGQSHQHVALLATALWLLAPLHVSTVLYAVQRMAQFAALFSLFGLCLFMHRRSQWAERGASVGDLLATGLWLLLLVLLAALSKENGLLLLWLLPVLEVTLFRGRWAGSDNRLVLWLGWLGVVAPLILLLTATLAVPELITDRYAGREFTLQERLLTQLRLLWQYVGWLLLPNINTMGFQHDDIALSSAWYQPWTTLLSAIAWMVMGALSWLMRRRLPLLGFALLFYWVGHAMESSVWPLEMVYEHRSYLPSVGVYILVAALLCGLLRRQQRVRPAIPLFALLAVVSILLLLRVQIWSDPLRLTTVNVRNHPESSRSHYFVAEAWLQKYRDALAKPDSQVDPSQYLLAARHHFELMYQKNPRDFAAIVMLYYLDSHHFRELRQFNDWFAILQEVAVSRPLQASDRNALDTLLDCFAAQVCDAPEAELYALLATLEERYPHSVEFMLMRYRYLLAVDAPLELRRDLLQRAAQVQPDNTRVYQYQLREFAAQGDWSSLYGAVKSWMQHDQRRQNVLVMRNLFDAPAPRLEGRAGR